MLEDNPIQTTRVAHHSIVTVKDENGEVIISDYAVILALNLETCLSLNDAVRPTEDYSKLFKPRNNCGCTRADHNYDCQFYRFVDDYSLDYLKSPPPGDDMPY